MAAKQRKSSVSPRLALLMALLAGAAVAASSCHSGESRYESDAQPKIPTYRSTEHKWAERIDLPGVPNLHKVSDDLYRGAQPSAEGMKQLEKLGIKTVVNLRFLTSDRKMLKGTQLDYEHINTTTLTTDTRDVIRFLKIAAAPERTPVFVHCHRGIDRAGVMCAAYRIVLEGWTREEAIEEMTKGGFTSRTIKKNLLDYIRKMNVSKIRCRA
ncbi:MAG: fused DSP-PTPase phosphatase/NAD kinase-like protein [Planctomycetota bacterium]|jgi:protein tyrosine/serine phosphatase